jgi:hypothetical protein
MEFGLSVVEKNLQAYMKTKSIKWSPDINLQNIQMILNSILLDVVPTIRQQCNSNQLLVHWNWISNGFKCPKLKT